MGPAIPGADMATLGYNRCMAVSGLVLEDGGTETEAIASLYAQTGHGIEQHRSAQRLVPSCADSKCTPAEVP